MLWEATYPVSLVRVKGLLGLLTLVVGLHVGIGCGVVHAAPAIQAPCCGQNCPMGSAVGAGACCHTQDSGFAAQEISRPSTPAPQRLISLTCTPVISSARGVIEQMSLVQDNPSAAAKRALLCSRQI
jgi:hypothetical protein